MINIDFLTIKAFFLENIDFFINARLQKIQQPTRRDFILYLRNNGESRKLYININPQIYHIAFMNKDNENNRSITIPKRPPMFCMLLRKYLEGAKIADAIVVENERILELIFEVSDELSQIRRLCLAIELMGKYSNVILYDKETSLIIGCAHNVGSEKSRYRELSGGLKYIYPPLRQQVMLSDELISQFNGLSEAEVSDYLSAMVYRPALRGDKYTLFQELLENSERQKSVSDMLDNYYSNFQNDLNIKIIKKQLSDIVNTKLKKINNSIIKVSSVLKKQDKMNIYKLYGELLTANLYKKSDYSKEIEVYDYINNKNIVIELDETKNLKENAQRYYKLYAKSKTTKEKSKEMLKNLEMESEYLQNIVYSIDRASFLKDLEDIKIELNFEQKEKCKTEKPAVEKIQINGFDVYIGKNNRQNDYIVSKLAKDDDYWFHTRLCAGSHVLLKNNGVEPNEALIYECCKIARQYSSANMPSKVGVIYTKAKNLKKPPNSPLGYVTYKNEKEILI